MDFWKTLLLLRDIRIILKTGSLKRPYSDHHGIPTGSLSRAFFQGISKFELKATKAGSEMGEGCACVSQRVKNF